ncbi:DUF2509 family protein [Erwiniaceae bacterium CAU 1747]
MRTQQGSGALLMVIVILLMGTVLLHATRRQLSDSLSLVSDERRYILEYTDAVSALAWGERLTWRRAEGWYCQLQPQYGWRACVLNHASGMLLRGDSGSGTLSLYRWVISRAGGKISAVPHGWLDYCPLPNRSLCDDSVSPSAGI